MNNDEFEKKLDQEAGIGEYEKAGAERERRQDLLRRAFAAYYKHHPIWKEWYSIKSRENHPEIGYCKIEQWEGVEYAILANMKQPLAVYRVAIRGQLQRVDDYPEAIFGLSI